MKNNSPHTPVENRFCLPAFFSTTQAALSLTNSTFLHRGPLASPFLSRSSVPGIARSARYARQPHKQHQQQRSTSLQCVSGNNPNGGGNFSDESGLSRQSMNEEDNPWNDALQQLLVEALRTYYQGTPIFSEAEFNTLRDELEHLGVSQLRLSSMERLWVQASSSRAFDKHLQQEFDLSEDELVKLKDSLLVQNLVSRPRYLSESNKKALPEESRDFVGDAEQLGANDDVNERLKWFLFSEASEERFKIMLLYLPAVVMSFVTACVFTILFALLDGEMQIYITSAGRFRLGILSYVVVMLTFWFSNQVTPTMMKYLDLGQPTLVRGNCPICGSSITCLFTGAARVRDERKCSTCGATIGFNRRWMKTYLVSPPGNTVKSGPD